MNSRHARWRRQTILIATGAVLACGQSLKIGPVANPAPQGTARITK